MDESLRSSPSIRAVGGHCGTSDSMELTPFLCLVPMVPTRRSGRPTRVQLDMSQTTGSLRSTFPQHGCKQCGRASATVQRGTEMSSSLVILPAFSVCPHLGANRPLYSTSPVHQARAI